MSFSKPRLSVAAALLATALLIPQHAAAREEFYSALKPCPVACSTSPDPSQWTLYTSVHRLSFCDEPTLFDVSLSAPIEDGFQITRVRACTAADADSENMINSIIEYTPDQSDSGLASFADLPKATEKSSTVRLASWGDRDSSTAGHQGSSLELLGKAGEWLRERQTDHHSTTTAILGHFNGTFVGYFGGARVDKTADGILDELAANIKEKGSPDVVLLQHCGQNDGKNITGSETSGIIVSTDSNVATVQDALRTWNSGECVVRAPDESDTLSDFAMTLHPYPDKPQPSRLQARAECRITRVEPKDLCSTLAARCGISGDDYMKYNPASDHCSTLMPGQAVCCSSGTLPDLRPDPKPDGSCFDYTTQSKDTCSAIAATYGMKAADLIALNKKTWGFSGCEPLGQGIAICLSKGDPPMPAPVDNAVCGPTKPGTKPPRGDQTLSDLNPCPLKVCCNIWGQCGTNPEFCTESKSETGAPGTAKPGSNGCVQNCGLDIVNNDKKPEKLYKLGYFEAWNVERECLTMDVRATANHRQAYTDVHFAFGEISPTFDIVIPENQQGEWEKFLAMKGDSVPRKILAFGGWDFSTKAETYRIFREVVSKDNRVAFAQKCADFAKKNNLDGLDFDWEYPGAPDLPEFDPGSPEDGSNYLAFLQELRKKLPDGVTLSIAAPASFWYLKGFPIARMAPLLDYIVYMTYDLHGQWDSGNKWTTPGCPEGNCLRSHVNLTETNYALSMITKAGVPAHKVLVGVPTFGRSFKMTDPNCRGPMCTFEGGRDNSQAMPGMCTDTRGYLANAEIQDIADGDVTSEHWYDGDTGADYLIYNEDEWVSYLSNTARMAREALFTIKNFGGTIEWAIDLAEFHEMNGDPEALALFDGPEPCEFKSSWKSLEDLEKAAPPEHCLPLFTLEILRNMITADIKKYQDLLDDGYDKSFDAYARAIRMSAPKVLEDWRLKEADKFFECDHERRIYCCDYCEDMGKYICDDTDRKHCEADGYPCNKKNTRLHNITVPACPDKDTKYGNWTYNFKDGKKDDFFKAALDDVGLREEDINFNRVLHASTEIGGPLPVRKCQVIPEYPCKYHYYRHCPQVSPAFTADDIPNPKDVIQEALHKMKNLPAELTGMLGLLHIGHFTDDWLHVTESVALPVFMAHEAVRSMAEAHEIGKDLLEDQMKNLILLLVQAVLFIIPFVGTAVGTVAGMASLGRMLALIGDVGLIGVDIYKIVDDPEQAPLLMVGILLTATGGLGNWNGLAKAAKIKMGMKPADMKKLGPNIMKHMDRVDAFTKKVKTVCPKYA